MCSNTAFAAVFKSLTCLVLSELILLTDDHRHNDARRQNELEVSRLNF